MNIPHEINPIFEVQEMNEIRINACVSWYNLAHVVCVECWNEIPEAEINKVLWNSMKSLSLTVAKHRLISNVCDPTVENVHRTQTSQSD